jgi:hypothetical protein
VTDYLDSYCLQLSIRLTATRKRAWERLAPEVGMSSAADGCDWLAWLKLAIEERSREQPGLRFTNVSHGAARN